jgi:hypothetical protein
MPSGLTYDLIKDFQELIVGFFGFAGVIWTLRQNGRLSRDQQEQTARLSREQHEREAQLRRDEHERSVQHERALITRALLAELKRNRQSLAENRSKLKEGHEGDLAIPRRTLTEVFDRLFERVSHLNSEELADVLQAYSTIKAVPERILFAQALHMGMERFEAISQSEHFIGVTCSFIGIYEELIKNALVAVDAAIASLEIGNSKLN